MQPRILSKKPVLPAWALEPMNCAWKYQDIRLSGLLHFRNMEPEALSVSAKVVNLTSQINLELDGAKTYLIYLNDKLYQTSDSRINLPLEKEVTELRVVSELECQGEFRQLINLSSIPLVSPNPIASGNLEVLLPDSEITSVNVSLHSLEGQQLISRKAPLMNGKLILNMDMYPVGIYLLNIKQGDQLYNYKIIKK